MVPRSPVRVPPLYVVLLRAVAVPRDPLRVEHLSVPLQCGDSPLRLSASLHATLLSVQYWSPMVPCALPLFVVVLHAVVVLRDPLRIKYLPRAPLRASYPSVSIYYACRTLRISPSLLAFTPHPYMSRPRFPFLPAVRVLVCTSWHARAVQSMQTHLPYSDGPPRPSARRPLLVVVLRAVVIFRDPLHIEHLSVPLRSGGGPLRPSATLHATPPSVQWWFPPRPSARSHCSSSSSVPW